LFKFNNSCADHNTFSQGKDARKSFSFGARHQTIVIAILANVTKAPF